MGLPVQEGNDGLEHRGAVFLQGIEVVALAGAGDVVIADDQNLAARDGAQQGEDQGVVSERHIAHDHEPVVGLHLAQLTHQGGIHGLRVGERAVAVGQHVAVAQVQVGSKPYPLAAVPSIAQCLAGVADDLGVGQAQHGAVDVWSGALLQAQGVLEPGERAPKGRRSK